MRFMIHTESMDVIRALASGDTSMILTEPSYSSRHPKIQDQKVFLDFFHEALEITPEIYIEINGYQEESNLEALRAWVMTLSKLPVRGIYFADPAILMILNDIGYEGKRIYAPETILTNLPDVKTLLGVVDRIVLARELTLEESLSITSQCPDNVEIFGLGHWLMSVSKRPQIRNYLKAIDRETDVLNRTDLRLREMKRLMFYPILEEKDTTSMFSSDILFPLEEIDRIETASCYGIHCDQLFISDEDFIRLVRALRTHSQVDLPSALSLSTGYFYRKTNLTKEENR